MFELSTITSHRGLGSSGGVCVCVCKTQCGRAALLLPNVPSQSIPIRQEYLKSVNVLLGDIFRLTI